MGHVHERRHRGEGRDDRTGFRLAGDVDGLARENHRTRARDREGQEAGQDARERTRPARSGAPVRRRQGRGGADHPLRGARGEPVRRRLQRRLSRTHRAPDRTRAARDGAADRARHRRARDHRLHRPVRRPVRHRLGHHEFVHRHLRIQDHQPRRGRARHRRSAARDRARPGRGDPGGGDLQSPRPLDLRPIARCWAMRPRK